MSGVRGRGRDGRLRARPSAAAQLSLPLGRSAPALEHDQDALLHVPPADAAGPVALVILLHGAGAPARAGMELLADLADEHGLALVALGARRATWDVISGGFGPDVTFIDGALEHVFASCPVDPARVAVGGYSDGASYALSLGITNGDLFTHIMAFSPGFAAAADAIGQPRVFVTHGVADRVLPIDRCSRRLVAALRAGGYDVTYEEFDGGHSVPPALALRAVERLGER